MHADDAAGIAAAFDLGGAAELTGVVDRGELGQVAQLATSRGLWAVKTTLEPPEDGDAEGDAFGAAARAAGVPTPAAVRTAHGSFTARVGGRQVRVYEWVDLRPLDRGIDPVGVGRLLAALHRVPFAGRRPQDPWYTEPVGAARWDGLIAELAAAGAPFAGDLGAARDDLVALEGLLEPAERVRTCHRDLWADNVRATRAGGLCVVDGDNCGAADPAHELVLVLFEFGNGDPVRARALDRAYHAAGGPARLRGRGDFSMLIAQLGHIVEWSSRRWLDPATPPAERERKAARVVEMAANPLTPDVVDALLDAVRE
jgi:aminoglycoside phosphotransferase (APT) family kinase protein